MAPEPAVCPICGSPTTRVLWNAKTYLGEHDKNEIAGGQAILGGDHAGKAPSRICLKCFPAWSEAHRLAWQDYEWQVGKERAIKSADFLGAAQFGDYQNNIRGKLQELVTKLLAEYERDNPDAPRSE